MRPGDKNHKVFFDLDVMSSLNHMRKAGNVCVCLQEDGSYRSYAMYKQDDGHVTENDKTTDRFLVPLGEGEPVSNDQRTMPRLTEPPPPPPPPPSQAAADGGSGGRISKLDVLPPRNTASKQEPE